MKVQLDMFGVNDLSSLSEPPTPFHLLDQRARISLAQSPCRGRGGYHCFEIHGRGATICEPCTARMVTLDPDAWRAFLRRVRRPGLTDTERRRADEAQLSEPPGLTRIPRPPSRAQVESARTPTLDAIGSGTTRTAGDSR